MDILTRFKQYMVRENMLEQTDVVVAAVSGGVDSMVMADLLWRLRDELGFRLMIASFDHQLRAEAAAEVEFVGDWARARRLPFTAGSADIPALSGGVNVEDVARRERYAFLRSVAFSAGRAVIATAHHRDDQAETVLLHLLRGSGPAGLAAMSPAENNVIRPLLTLSRAEIEAYAAEQGIEHCEDASNASVKYLRNRIRLQLLPQLETYNPRIRDALTATATICRDEDALLNDMAQVSLAELWSMEQGSLNGAGFDQLSPALQRRVLRLAFCLPAGDGPELSFAQVEACRALKEGQSCTLPRGVQAFRRAGDLCLAAELPQPVVYDQTWPLLADGQWHDLPQLGTSYCAHEIAQPPAFHPDHFLLPAAMAESAFWRTRRAGDSVPSRGKKGRRKLKTMFIDAHLPQWRRDSWPLLANSEGLLWIPGLWRRSFSANDKWMLIKLTVCDKIIN